MHVNKVNVNHYTFLLGACDEDDEHDISLDKLIHSNSVLYTKEITIKCLVTSATDVACALIIEVINESRMLLAW